MLKMFNVSDEQVQFFEQSRNEQITNMLWSLAKLLINLVFVLPGNIMIMPLSASVALKGEEERIKALKGSVVKVKGNDILASFKVKTYLVAFPIYLIVFTYLYNLFIRYYYDLSRWDSIWSTLLFFLVFPIL